MSDQNLTDWRKLGLKLEAEINKVILGQEAPIRLITNAIFARGHVLLEGDVGVGKQHYLKHLRDQLVEDMKELREQLI